MQTLRGRILRKPAPPASGLDLSMAFGNTNQLIGQLQQLKQELIAISNAKIKEIDTKIETHINNLQDASETLKTTQQAVLDHVQTILKGEPGTPADEQAIERRLTAKIPPAVDTGRLSQQILSQVPKIDEKALVNRIIQALPKNKASLKIIRESFEVDPLSVIEKIMALPEGKFKLTTKHIDGLEQTMSAFRSQLGRGYLHGGGTTLGPAGTGIILSNNPNGTVTISSTGGGIGLLTVTGTVNGINQIFTVISKPSVVVSDGISLTEKDNNSNAQWSYSGTTLTLVEPPPVNSIFAYS